MNFVAGDNMEKNILDTIIGLVGEKYLFRELEENKWKQLCNNYYSMIRNDDGDYYISELFRKMNDPHLKYSSNVNLNFTHAPILWNQNHLYWIKEKNQKKIPYEIKSINGENINSILEDYSTRYNFNINITKSLVLEDIMLGRIRNQGFVYFNIVNNTGIFEEKIPIEKVKYVKNVPMQNGTVIYKTKFDIFKEKILYIKINNFYTKQDFKCLFSLINKNISTLIFDLRDNLGGYISIAKQNLALFLNEQVCIDYYNVLNRLRAYNHTIEPIKGNVGIEEKKIYVLVNENTMSSAEYIFTLGLKKAYNCIIVGQETMGLCGECKTFNIINKGVLRITTQKYIDFNNNYISSVEPDVFIDRDIDNIVNGIDQQLKYIIDREV